MWLVTWDVMIVFSCQAWRWFSNSMALWGVMGGVMGAQTECDFANIQAQFMQLSECVAMEEVSDVN